MSKDFSVHVEHVTRVEGHGNIILDVKNGKIEKLQWNVVEAPRFFEAMLRGQHYNELAPNHVTDLWYLFDWSFPCVTQGDRGRIRSKNYEPNRDTTSISDSCGEHAEPYSSYRVPCGT